MITCPTCGRPVPESQRFCGNCGTDVQAATAFRAPAQNPAGAAPTPAAPGGVYGYEPGAYDYQPAAPQRPAAMIWLIVAGAAIVCLCCGLVIGGVVSYVFFPTQSVPPITPSPTPEGLNLLITLLSL